jgi:hypothetical protein
VVFKLIGNETSDDVRVILIHYWVYQIISINDIINTRNLRKRENYYVDFKYGKRTHDTK